GNIAIVRDPVGLTIGFEFIRNTVAVTITDSIDRRDPYRRSVRAVLDPRARHIKRFAEALTRDTEHERTFRTLVAIEARFTERMAAQGKSLYANLEFYKGVVYRALGLPTRFFTSCFAMARVYGYIAHFIESREDNRIIRPAAHYVGPSIGRTVGEAVTTPVSG
ncbi:MAG: citrate/2-methylcitrate synthase, partial [Pseudomonadales bacterium]